MINVLHVELVLKPAHVILLSYVKKVRKTEEFLFPVLTRKKEAPPKRIVQLPVLVAENVKRNVKIRCDYYR